MEWFYGREYAALSRGGEERAWGAGRTGIDNKTQGRTRWEVIPLPHGIIFDRGAKTLPIQWGGSPYKPNYSSNTIPEDKMKAIIE
jgi:hypothetical protein